MDDELLSLIAHDRGLCLPAILRVSFTKIVSFLYLSPETIVAGAQRNPVIPSSTLLVSPTSSLYPDANEGIGLRETESLDCLTLQLGHTNQMWVWEQLELLVTKGYQKAVGAKLLHVVDETFCSIPNDSTNYRYLVRLTSGASAAR